MGLLSWLFGNNRAETAVTAAPETKDVEDSTSSTPKTIDQSEVPTDAFGIHLSKYTYLRDGAGNFLRVRVDGPNHRADVYSIVFNVSSPDGSDMRTYEKTFPTVDKANDFVDGTSMKMDVWSSSEKTLFQMMSYMPVQRVM